VYIKDTHYRIAENPRDYRKCRTLAKDIGTPLDSPLQYPTVLAEREVGVVGFLSSRRREKYIEAGPMIVQSNRPIFMAIRLIDAYDEFLRRGGVRNYIFHVEEKNLGWLNSIREALKVEPYAIQDGLAWFERAI